MISAHSHAHLSVTKQRLWLVGYLTRTHESFLPNGGRDRYDGTPPPVPPGDHMNKSNKQRTEGCDGCDKEFDPKLLTTCRYTESDGNIECLRFCPTCIEEKP